MVKTLDSDRPFLDHYTLPEWWKSDWPTWFWFSKGRPTEGPLVYAYPVYPNFGVYVVIPQR